MSHDDTLKWIDELRTFVLTEWDDKGIPPTIGLDTKDIIKNFRKLREYPLHQGKKQFLINDDIIKNYNKQASSVNQFFPTMLKTRVNNGSIYDWFTDDYREKFTKVMLRVIKRDGMYNYSKCIPRGSDLPENWFVVQQKRTDDVSKYYSMKSDEVKKLDSKYTTNITDYDDEKFIYLVRVFELGQKIFPSAIQGFRLGLGQPAVNFPPLTARYLYERYTDHINIDELEDKQLNIYDPSSGWGGRILGAMSSKKQIHYVGTDPNTDNFIDEVGISRYEYVANFYNNEVLGGNDFWDTEHKNTFHYFQMGSEHIGDHPDFQQYKGKLDMVFTSPPYFDREQYSDDDEQSFKAYPKYDDWRDNFLNPTLTNAYQSLRKDRYLLWNIADIKIGKDKYHPLEQDSIDIIENLGGEYQGKLKMLMTSMVGVDQSNVKYSVKVNGTYLKYEPIFIFYKK